jgi:predicted anti-sigma-YlaC factor YlaD
MKNTNLCEHIGEQLSGFLDGELSQQESQRISVHLSQCESCSQTYEQLKQIQGAVSQTYYPNMEQQKMNTVLQDLTSKRMFDFAWFAIVSGVLISIVFSVYHFWFDSSIPLYSKLVMSLIWGGGIGLFLTVLRQRLIISKTDKYNKVDL